MEYLMQWEFWQNIGLTVAARLSVVAVALWAVKMVTDQAQREPAGVSSPGSITLRRGSEQRVPNTTRVAKPDLDMPSAVSGRKAGDRAVEQWREKMARYLAGDSSFPSDAVQGKKVR